MIKLKLSKKAPGLLVSVRSAAEASTALAGGADVIDVKEPSQGSLGAADEKTIAAVVHAVDGRAPVSAALGELVDLIDSPTGDSISKLVDGVALFKIGLAGCATRNNWQSRWSQTVETIISTSSNGNAQAVAVVYADWRTASSPSPQDILSAAIQCRCPALLIDTCDKSAGSLFDHWPAGDLQGFITDVQSRDIAVVLAGSLTLRNATTAAQLGPDLVAVRTAACEGGRAGTVSETKVRELKNAIASAIRNVAVL